jgi:hypothetical protein
MNLSFFQFKTLTLTGLFIIGLIASPGLAQEASTAPHANSPEAIPQPPVTNFYVSLSSGRQILLNTPQDLASDQKFLKEREFYLQKTVKALEQMKLGLGTIVATKEKVSHIKHLFKKDVTHSADNIQQSPEPQEAKALEEINTKVRMSLRERGEQLITEIIQGLNETFIKNSTLITQGAGVGFLVGIGPQLVAAAGEKGWGFVAGLGLSINFFRHEKAVVIDFFVNTEKFQKTLMKIVGTVGVAMKAGVQISSLNFIHNSRSEGVIHFYPPAIPGFVHYGPGVFASGFSSGLTLPPSPIGDMITFQTEAKRFSLLQIEFSPAFPFFVRVKTGLLDWPKIWSKKERKSELASGISCHSLFAQ